MSLVDSYHVHLGFWTNWDHGKIEGATITLTRRNGGLLVAFIAIFVGAAGKSFWRLACFLLHRMLSNSDPQDGIYHQLQAILRNSDTAQDAAWSLGQVMWAWRVPARVRKPFPRLIGIITLALFVSISFGVAGVFSSQITTDTANEVLLTGNNCGPLKANDDVDVEAYNMLFEPHQHQRVTAYSNYALQCYTGNTTTAAEDCAPYVKANLESKVTRNASCPFASEMCKSDSDNLIVDSGYIDSNEHLGINAPAKDRFQVRMLHHCAPLVTEGFTNTSVGANTSEVFQRYWYGGLAPPINFTQEVSLNETDSYKALKNTRQRARADYAINVLKAYGGPLDLSKEFSMFEPIKQLQRADADTMLFFLTARGVLFAKQVDDPWFSARRKGPKVGGGPSDEWSQLWLQDEPIGVMGCAMQMQFCNPNLPEGQRCEPMRGTIDDSYPVLDLYKEKSQKKSFQWAIDIIRLSFFSISGIVESLGNSCLTARQGLGNNMQGPLPSNQWQLEVEHWVGASLASLQGSFVEAGNGPTPTYQQFRRAPNITEEKNFCKNQKIMTTKYSSFSVLGVSLILAIGGLFILLDLGLPYVVDYIQVRRSKEHPNPSGTYARLEWDTNTTLQLQRLAHEHIGVGAWSSRWQHPITAPGEKLAMIDASDENHTLFIAPQNWEGFSRQGKPLSRGSNTASSTTEDEQVKRAHTYDSIESAEMRRADTFGSTEKRVGRIDTKTTLVNEITSVEGTPTTIRRASDEISRAL